MAKIARFEDIESWKLARDVTRSIYGKLDETGRLIGGLMKYLRQSDLKGSKFA